MKNMKGNRLGNMKKKHGNGTLMASRKSRCVVEICIENDGTRCNNA